MAHHRVSVGPLPAWFPAQRLLGPGDWTVEGSQWTATLGTAAAADLATRLRNVVLAGHALVTTVLPPLKRRFVREARTVEARRMRHGSETFSRPDLHTDDTARAWVTPEELALRLGEQAKGRKVVDCCCGLGGNAIGFARAGCSVVAIDLEPRWLSFAASNARAYGVADRLHFQQGRAEELAPNFGGDLWFVDPPWGEAYRSPTTLADYPLVEALLGQGVEVWAKLPPGFDPTSIPGGHPEAWFGTGEGDARRVKFLLVRVPA